MASQTGVPVFSPVAFVTWLLAMDARAAVAEHADGLVLEVGVADAFDGDGDAVGVQEGDVGEAVRNRACRREQ